MDKPAVRTTVNLALLPVCRDAFWFGSAKCFRPRAIAGILCFFVLLAGSLTAHPQRFQARLFGQDDGLDNLTISSIAQDKRGFLWVAAQNGLFRYDGARFQSFGAPEGLKDPSVLTLFVARKGTLWAGTHTGLFWFDGTSFQELRSLRVSDPVGGYDARGPHCRKPSPKFLFTKR